MGAIFLSYAREDRPFAERLVRVLEAAGHRIWWDRHIDGGEEFAAEIEAALAEADVVLVAWSRDSVGSRWVRDEAAIGGDSGRLVPLSIDGTLPPMGFRQFHTPDLTGWKGTNKDERTADLLRAVDRRLKGKSAPRAARTRKPRLAILGWLEGWRLWTMAAALALAVATAVAFVVLRPGSAEAEPASLAVLPFKTMAAGDPYFAEGVTEEIADRLSRDPQFKVAGRTSSELFKDAADLRDVGRRLQVAYVLEGSVRSAGKRVRVNVALVDTRKGLRLWAQDFNGSMDDIFAIQDDIGQQVAGHVRKQLVREVVPAALRTRGDVYSLYVTARGMIRSRTPTNLHSAVELLRQAVKLDPNYAPAWARLAEAERLDWVWDTAPPPVEPLRGEWLKHAQRALQLAPNLPEAHIAMYYVLSAFTDVDPVKVQSLMNRHSRRALELNPNDADIWKIVATGYEFEGDYPRALDAWRRAHAIDPLWWLAFYDLSNLAWAMGYRDESDAIVRRVIRDGTRFDGLMMRADWAGRRGRFGEEYRIRKAGLAVADPGQLAILNNMAIPGQLRMLGYFAEAKAKAGLDDDVLRMWNGEAPSPQAVAGMEKQPRAFWDDPSRSLVLRALVRNGRSAEVVRLYDLRYRSPEQAERESAEKLAFVGDAPVIAIALREVGRSAEADRLLVSANGVAQSILGHGRVPAFFYFPYAKLFAVEGKRNAAIAALQKGVDLGWFYCTDETSFRDIGQEPAFRDLAYDPRFQRIRAYFAAHLAKERRAAGPISS